LRPSGSGLRAERLACAYLQGRGLELLHSNWRCRFGEIDLVLREGDTIVFVEVRLRTNPNFGGAGESIHRAKRERLLAAARLYLSHGAPRPCRFDVVLLRRLEPPDIEWIRDAIAEH
jgi:putative endonuclease